MKQARTQDRLIFKISLLSISLFFMLPQAISPALPLMYHAFPGVNHAGVELLSTIPNIGVVVGLLLNPLTIKWIGQKITIMTGLVMMIFTGILPMLASQYMPIFISRFLLGVGVGLFTSLAVSLIPQFYSDDENELATMVGLQSVMASVGIAIASFVMSYLVTLSWHAAFVVYFLGVPSLILFGIFVPLKKQGKEAKQSQHQSQFKAAINSHSVLIAVLMFFIYVFYMTISFKLPSFVVEQKLGNVSALSVLNGFLSLVAIPVGGSFGFLYKRLHDKMFPLTFLVLTVGFLIVSFAPNFVILVVGTLLIGIGFGLIVPYMYNWLDWSVPKPAINLATTIVLVFINVGAAVSPMIIDAISHTPKAAMVASGIFYALLMIYALLHYSRAHRVFKKAN